jgi:DNA primase catalytic subunit
MELGEPVCFFSGGKGVHIWMVGSDAAPLHRQDTRVRLVEYLQSVLGKGVRDEAFPDRPANMEPSFVQDALGAEDRRVYYTNFLRNTMNLRAAFDRHASHYGRDSAIVHALWPAVDEDVTTDPRHKIKAPFCVHARTSKACVWLPNAGVNPYTTPIDPMQNAADLGKLLRGGGVFAVKFEL